MKHYSEWTHESNRHNIEWKTTAKVTAVASFFFLIFWFCSQIPSFFSFSLTWKPRFFLVFFYILIFFAKCLLFIFLSHLETEFFSCVFYIIWFSSQMPSFYLFRSLVVFFLFRFLYFDSSQTPSFFSFSLTWKPCRTDWAMYGMNLCRLPRSTTTPLTPEAFFAAARAASCARAFCWDSTLVKACAVVQHI